MEIQLVQQRLHGRPLIRRQHLAGTASAARSWRRGRTPAVRDQVAGQDRVHLILDPGPLPDQVRPAAHLTAQLPGPLIRQPHRRQELRGQQLRQDPCVDLRILRTNRTVPGRAGGLEGGVRRGSEPLGMIALEALIGGPPEISGPVEPLVRSIRIPLRRKLISEAAWSFASCLAHSR
jgi:hypothetical protein